jgi:hypothetical protein
MRVAFCLRARLRVRRGVPPRMWARVLCIYNRGATVSCFHSQPSLQSARQFMLTSHTLSAVAWLGAADFFTEKGIAKEA